MVSRELNYGNVKKAINNVVTIPCLYHPLLCAETAP